MKRFLLLLPVIAGAWGCQPASDLPASYIADPRVLAIKAEPPEVPAGGTTSVTAWVVGTDGQTPVVSWSRCRRPPLPGQAINPDCLKNPQAAYVEPIGDGATITTTMPADITPDALGLPDASGGVYLPLIARVTVGGEQLTASYRLRLGQPGATANHNPVIDGVYIIDAAGGATPFDEAVPYVVHSGDVVTVSLSVSADSMESYLSPVASGGPVTETLTSSWFASGGDTGNSRTNNGQPSMVLHFDKRLPAVGSPIDLYLVTRDERGGTDYAHRTFSLQ